MTSGGRCWVGLAALLGLIATVLFGAPRMALDWQPALASTEPWRAFTAVGVHYSALHLGANLAGVVLVAALGSAARPPAGLALAWAVAWPATHWALAVRPDLTHYGGLSGVLHAGAAVVAVYLVHAGPRARRLVGGALLAGLLAKVWTEVPWGPPLRHPPGWDIAVAPLAHATGLLCGGVCAAAVLAWGGRLPRHA